MSIAEFVHELNQANLMTDTPSSAPVPPTGGGFEPTGDTAQADEPVAAPPDEKLLDEALKETFPASDPISPAAAESAAESEPPPSGTPPLPPPSDAPFPFPTSESVRRQSPAPVEDAGDAGVVSPS